MTPEEKEQLHKEWANMYAESGDYESMYDWWLQKVEEGCDKYFPMKMKDWRREDYEINGQKHAMVVREDDEGIEWVCKDHFDRMKLLTVCNLEKK